MCGVCKCKVQQPSSHANQGRGLNRVGEINLRSVVPSSVPRRNHAAPVSSSASRAPNGSSLSPFALADRRGNLSCDHSIRDLTRSRLSAPPVSSEPCPSRLGPSLCRQPACRPNRCAGLQARSEPCGLPSVLSPQVRSALVHIRRRTSQCTVALSLARSLCRQWLDITGRHAPSRP